MPEPTITHIWVREQLAGNLFSLHRLQGSNSGDQDWHHLPLSRELSYYQSLFFFFKRTIRMLKNKISHFLLINSRIFNLVELVI